MCPGETKIIEQARRFLQTAVPWAAGALAIYAGFDSRPSVSYTIGAALLGIMWAALLALSWRTRRSLWSIVAVVALVMGNGILRDTLFPGQGFFRGIYGISIAAGTGTLLLAIFRRHVSRFCRLDSDAPND
jgi:hypothetical protein